MCGLIEGERVGLHILGKKREVSENDIHVHAKPKGGGTYLLVVGENDGEREGRDVVGVLLGERVGTEDVGDNVGLLVVGD